MYRNAASTGGDMVENIICKDCTKYKMSCAPAPDGCCKCECPSNKPNYIVGKGECISNDGLMQQLPNASKRKYFR